MVSVNLTFFVCVCVLSLEKKWSWICTSTINTILFYCLYFTVKAETAPLYQNTILGHITDPQRRAVDNKLLHQRYEKSNFHLLANLRGYFWVFRAPGSRGTMSARTSKTFILLPSDSNEHVWGHVQELLQNIAMGIESHAKKKIFFFFFFYIFWWYYTTIGEP